MDLAPLRSGAAGVWADAVHFLAGVTFARPGWLWLSLLPVAVTVAALVTHRIKRRQALALGRPGAVAALFTNRPGGNRLARLMLGMAWTALVLGAAGPRWGVGDDGGAAVGRDVVLVIDLSRSMTATDLRTASPRWVAAVNGAKDLVAAARTRGGHRVGVVVFAARPKVFAPLTTDYDFLDRKLDQLLETGPALNALRPTDDAAVSGTRIGAALKLAVDAHDPRFPGSQDILLLTDGDDPADDREWASGVTAARAAGIPVHVVGIGNPTEMTPLVIPGRVGADGLPELITTQLVEETTTAIAREGRGHYLPSRTAPIPPLGEFFRTHVEPFPSRDLADDAVPQPRDRSVWFFAAAFVFLVGGWVRER